MTQQEVRHGHPYFMYDAIIRQPDTMEEMLRKHANLVQPAAADLARKRRIHLVGIGTSWHAALVARHWFRKFAGTGPEVEAWHSFEFCAYPPLSADDAVIVISHRGTKTYSILALEMAKSSDAYTVAITSTNPGPRITAADVHLTTVEQERSSAFTVSYTAALTVLALMAAAMGGWTGQSDDVAQLRAQLEDIPQAVSQVLARQSEVQHAVRRFQSKGRFICAAWGPNIANTYEVALKIKETSACDSEGLQIEQLLHGPFCSVDEKCLITLLAPPGPGYERAMNVARAATEVGAPVWSLVQEGDALLSDLTTESFSLPQVPELWSPLLYVLPLQLFTYYLAVARGAQPDQFQQNNPRQAAARRHYEL
jgi:glucosamine--fructose-6-phosphate aminotransferase (isomerizing)